ncbi:MAG TPA: hypothetical protein VEJ63_08960 [Planctomycetota bacterium]|nr:hypothetical protein [Planctomycetota bacterium]
MRPTVLLLILFLSLNASSATDVDQLVKQLDHDDFAERESACAELLKLGPAIERPLRDCVQTTRSPEQKQRAEALLKALEAEILLKDIEGGNSSAGLQLTLASAANEFKSSEGVRLVARLKNVSNGEIQCVPLREFCVNSPTLDQSSNTAQGVLTIRRVSGEESGSKTISASFDLRRGQPDPIKLPRGESSVISVRLIEDQALPPGEYEATAKYNAKSNDLHSGAKEDLTSNTIKFRVK